jgi:hypothetical protein
MRGRYGKPKNILPSFRLRRNEEWIFFGSGVGVKAKAQTYFWGTQKYVYLTPIKTLPED